MDVADDSHAALVLHELWYHVCHDVGDGDDDPQPPAAAATAAMATPSTTPEFHSEAAKGHEEGNSTSGYIQLPAEMEKMTSPEVRDKMTSPEVRDKMTSPEVQGAFTQDSNSPLGRTFQLEKEKEEEEESVSTLPPVEVLPAFQLNSSDSGTNRDGGLLHLTNILTLLEQLEEVRRRNAALERRCAFLHQLQSLVTYQNSVLQAENWKRSRRRKQQQRHGAKGGAGFHGGGSTWSDGNHLSPGRGGGVEFFARNPSRSTDNDVTGTERITSPPPLNFSEKSMKWERKKSKKLQAKWEQVKKVFTSGGGGGGGKPEVASNRPETGSSTPKSREKPRNRKSKKRFATIVALNKDTLEAIRSTLASEGGRREGQREGQPDEEEPSSPSSVKSEPAGIEPGDDDEEATERCVWSFVAHLDEERSPASKQVTLRRSHSSQSKITETDSKVETKVETGGGTGAGGGGRGISRSRSFMTSRDTATDVPEGLMDAAPVESSKSVPSSPVDTKTTQDLDPKQEEERIVTSSAQVQPSSYGAEAGKRAKAAWDKVKDMIQTRRDSFRLKGQQRRSSVGDDGDDGQRKPEERHKNSLGHVDAGGGGGANDIIDGDNCASSAEVVVEGNDVRGGHVTVAPQKSSGSDEGSSASSPTRCTGSLAKSTVTSQTVAKERHDVTGAAKTPTTENDKSTKDEETTAKRSNQREKSIGAGKKKTTKNIGRAKSVDTSIVKFSEDFISKMEQWEEKQKLAAHPVRVKRNSESMDCPLDPTTAAEPKEQLSESFMKTLENWAKVRGGRAKSREGRSRDTEQSRSRERAKSAQRVEKALQKIGKKEQKLGTELQKLADMKQKLETSVRENTHQGQGPDKVKAAAAKVKESGDNDVNADGVVGIVENAEEPEKMENHEVCRVSNEFKDNERIEMSQKRKHSIQDRIEDHKNSAAIPSGDERQNHGAVDGRFNRRSVSDPGEIRNKSSEEERENAPSATTSDKNAALSCDNFSSVKTKLEFDDVTFETEESANDVGLQTNDVTGVEFEDGESVKRKKVEDTVKKLEEELRTKNELMTSLDRKFEEIQTKILQLHLDKEREEEAKELDSIKMETGKSISSSFAFKDTEERQESTDQKDQDSSYSTNGAYGTSTPSAISTSTNAVKTSKVGTDVISTITIGAHAIDVNSLKNNDNSKIISCSNPTGTSSSRHSITGTGTGTRADRALAVPDSCLHFGQRGNGVPGTPGATGTPSESITVTCYRTLSLSSFRSSGKARTSAEDDGTSSSAFHSIGEPIKTKEPTHVTPPSVTSFGVADCVAVKSKPVAVTFGDVRGHETRQDAETEEEAVNPGARDAGATGDPGRVSSDVDSAPRNVSGRFVRVFPRDVIVSASDLSTQRQWRHQRRHSDDKKSFTDDVTTDDNEDSVTTVGVSANSHLFSSRGSPLYRTLPSYHHERRPPAQEGPTSGHRAGHFRLSRDPPFVRASGPPLIVVRSLKTAAELMAEVRRPRGKMTSSKRPASENFTKRQRRTQRHEDSPATVEDHRHHALTPPTPPPPQPSLHPPETTSDTLPTDPKTLSSLPVNHRKTDSTDDVDASNPVFETSTRGHSTTGKLSSNPSTPHSPNTTSVSPTRSTTGHRKSKPPPSKWETTFLEMGPDHPTADSTSKTVTGRSQTVSFDLGECPQQTPKQPPRAAAGNGSREGQPGETLGPPTGVKQGPDPQPPQKTKRNLIDIGWLNKSKKFFKTSKQW